MPEIYLTIALLTITVLLEWLCKSATIRRVLGLSLITLGITTCSQLGTEQVLALDGGWWGWFFSCLGYFLLWKRSSFFDRQKN